MTDTANMVRAIRLRAEDTVAVLTQAVRKGESVLISGPGAPLTIAAAENIPCYHKIALAGVASGACLLRSGIVIGTATSAIHTGDCVHIHNLASIFATRTKVRA